MNHPLSLSRSLLFPLVALLPMACGGPEAEIEQKLGDHVLFFSNFEKGVDALSSAGATLAAIDGALTRHHISGGKVDGYLTFEEGGGALRYEAQGNLPYKSQSPWSGSVSFWLRVDPQKDLSASYPEPFHIGPAWDDAVVFVDFDKKSVPPALRFGCYPNKTGEITDQMVQQRVIRTPGLDWNSDSWHHVAISWSNFNSGRSDAEWALYLDGKEIGRKSGLNQELAWDLSTQKIRFNHYKYSGDLDEIAIFDVPLNPRDAAYLANPRKDLNVLLKKDR